MCASHGRAKRHPVRKAVWFVTAAVTAAGGVWLLWVGSAPPRSTHHSQIRLELIESGGPPAAKLAEYDRIIGVLDVWAAEAGLYRVLPEQAGSMHLSWGTSAANGNERVTCFRETKPGDPSWPIEVMVTFDPDGAPVMEITTAEGHYKQPSPKLHDLHRTLLEHLKEQCRNQVLFSGIW
jgi:hypothetical protein